MSRYALAILATLAALWVGPTVSSAAEFGIEPGSLEVGASNSDGTPNLQASSHPFAFTVSFDLRTDAEGHSIGGELRDVIVDLPPGLVGNPAAVPQCTRQEFEGGTPQCSPASQIGIVHALLSLGGQSSGPLYNLEPPPGTAAQLGFSLFGLNALQNASVRSDEGYRLQVLTNGLPVEITAISATIWGTPADHAHDDQRGAQAAAGHGEPVETDVPELPFLTMPANCSAPLETRVEVDSKLAPGVFTGESAFSLDTGGYPAALLGCGSVPFGPEAFAVPGTTRAANPSGLEFRLGLANQGLMNPEGISETQPEKVEVELPAGLFANPALAGGLSACSEAQFRAATADDPGCPDASKVGTLFAQTPLLKESLEGSVYLATPHANPFNSLAALYLVASIPARGIVIKQAGEVRIDPQNGQITTSFDGLPPLPYSALELDLRDGPRAPLITPTLCGRYTATAKFYPFSDPAEATVRQIPFTISSGADGLNCPSSEAAQRNQPGFEAGTVVPIASGYSPFLFRLTRADGDQMFSRVSASLPEGLVGKLAGIPYCSDAAIAAARARFHDGDGVLEVASPSCPGASRVGSVDVAAGAGSQPVHVQGSAYLAGPYEGAPLSLAIITPAIAGPFDLGTVVVRTALELNERTARITAVSDPLPQSLNGIPLSMRSIALNMDRRHFTLNPSSCAPKAVAGEETSSLGQVAFLSSRFQVGGCKGLEFAPHLAIHLKGATKRAGHPALKAVLTYPEGGEYSNIANAQVGLPRALFLDQGNLNKVCKQAELKVASCPKTSIYGRAKAWTPLLDHPLEGPVYLGVGYGYKLPALVADLNGQIRILLVGKVDTTKKGGLRNTFEVVPDAPVSRFVLEMKGGKKYSLLENSENLCARPQRASARFTAQNGLVVHRTPRISVGCHKKHHTPKSK